MGHSYRSGALQRISRPIECDCYDMDMMVRVIEMRFRMEELEYERSYQGA